MTFRMPSHRFHVLLIGALLSCAAGCETPGANGPADSFGLDFSLPPDSPVHGALVFMVDGVNARVFQEMMEANELPALRRYFVDRGLYCPRAVSSMPGVTLPNLVSHVTGVFPGHHGVSGIQWFDRNQLVYRNYNTIAQKNTLDEDYTAPTIYERLPGEATFSCFFQPHRGATVWDENAIPGAIVYFAAMWEYMDRMTLSLLTPVTDQARAMRRFPAFTMCYLLAPDFQAYNYGMDDGRYRHALRHTDRQIGRVLGDLERAGLLEKVHIALLSDHGMMPTPRHFDLRQFLADRAGLKIASDGPWETTPFAKRQEEFNKSTAVACLSGNRYFALQVRKVTREGNTPDRLSPWLDRPTPQDLRAYPARNGKPVDLLNLLVGEESVDAAAYAAGKDRVRIVRKGGEVEFRQDAGPGGDISFSVVAGKDPLEWLDQLPADLAAGTPATPRRWLEATAGTQFPDLPTQVLAYFRGRRAADLAVFATPGWDFLVENQSGHGGLRPEEVFTPLLLAGPGVPHATLPTARTVDLMPTLLRLLGRPIPPGLDGVPLVKEARPASAPSR